VIESKIYERLNSVCSTLDLQILESTYKNLLIAERSLNQVCRPHSIGALDKFDFVLACYTLPEKIAPKVLQIADKFKLDATYFTKNKSSGIETAQDEGILSYLMDSLIPSNTSEDLNTKDKYYTVSEFGEFEYKKVSAFSERYEYVRPILHTYSLEEFQYAIKYSTSSYRSCRDCTTDYYNHYRLIAKNGNFIEIGVGEKSEKFNKIANISRVQNKWMLVNYNLYDKELNLVSENLDRREEEDSAPCLFFVEGKYGFVFNNGVILFPFILDKAEPFDFDNAKVEMGGGKI
jgi:hypothetical protein